MRALGRNTLVYLTQEGLRGVKIRSGAVIFLAVLVPLFLVSAAYYAAHTVALAVYVMIWIAASALLYDELRWRGVRSLGENPPPADGKRESWLVPWQSIRMADWNGRTLWFTSASPRRKLSVTFDRDDAPFVERALDSMGVRYSRRGPRLPPALTQFSTLALLLFIIGQVILILAALLPYFPGEQQAYTTILTNTKNQINGTTSIGEFQDIFLNNVQVAWGGGIPVLGALTYGAASYNTGRVVQAIAITNINPLTSAPQPLPPYAVLIGLYLLPHTWVEESAYPIATVAGMLALTKWRSVSPAEFAGKRNWGSTKLAFALGGAAVILVVAGILEVSVAYLGYGAVALWVPLALLYYGWVRRRRKHAVQTVGST